jgi:hypothetical protein
MHTSRSSTTRSSRTRRSSWSEGAPPGAFALHKAEVNAHLTHNDGQRVRARGGTGTG